MRHFCKHWRLTALVELAKDSTMYSYHLGLPTGVVGRKDQR
jgi:hypothetical protein